MIHTVLLKLADRLPLFPPAVALVGAALVIILTLWLLGRSRQTALFAVAVGILGFGLAVGFFGLNHSGDPVTWGALEEVAERFIGPASFRRYEQFTAAGLVLAAAFLVLVYSLATRELPGERARRLLEQDHAQSSTLGSAHLCAPHTFRRWSKPDPWGWNLQGRFWGAKGQLLGERFSLSGEDIARGVAVFGPQGSGKTQGVILPAIADRMRDGHSLIVTDVQGELQPYIQKLASITGHLVVVHNPSEPQGSCRINLCNWIHDVADAQAMAAVLLSADRQHGGDSFWRQAATNLLAACALHYPSLGAVLDARQDLKQMARDLKASAAPGAADLAADFANSMATRDPRLALNIMATAFESGLAPWADPALRAITDQTDLDLATQLTRTRTVLILRCARRHTAAYGPYLGTILRVLVSRLDDLGEQGGGPLPIPVGLILEEFPALGRLDSLVRDVNLVRKRRISVLTAAQSLAQFDHIYAAPGETDQLLAGLATKIVFGGCDGRTAGYFSELSGQQTVALTSFSRSRRPGQGMQDSSTASLRGRALLLPDDLIRPERGHATVFAAYGTADSRGGRAEQAIFHAELTPFFRRKDWKLDSVQSTAPTTAPRLPRSKPAASAPATSEPTGKPPQTSEPEPEGLDRDLELTEALTQFEVEGL
jgi:type IV secretory pathway TraG/TraD family ATPase VirD4